MIKTVKLKKSIAAILCIAIPLQLSGCWDYHEVEMYSIVSGVAIDKGQNGYKYHLTIEYLDINGKVEESQTKPLTVETDGNTVFDAERAALKKSGKKFYFSNCKIMIVSKELAAEGIKPLLDWFIRDAEIRITLEIIVSKEETAGEILRFKAKSQEANSFQIADMLNEASSYYAWDHSLQLYEIVNILNTPGENLSLPGIHIKDDEGGPALELTANSVFKNGKLVGWLSSEQNEYYMFAKDKIQGGVIVMGLTPDKKDMALEIFKSQTKVTPIVNGQNVTIKIDVETAAGYAEENTSQNYLDKYGIGTIENCADRTVKNGILGVIASVKKQYGSDIFGFGKTVYEKYPAVWEKLQKSGGNVFDKLNFEVNTNVSIKNTALALKKGGD